ncbi:unnamed protein product [Phytophthora lilii]|uniref:Unnamed protein product n=1 Tax=Phytophthora lilii TaxID=2077276 RepID=A0A9W6YDJ4_9STRA|nr:unnamed protein product [Phytophthora lilii]
MLDVRAVGADLTPAQRDETVKDVAFFLDEFGSTRAVRARLRAQELEVGRLQKRVWTLLGNDNMSNLQQEEENGDKEMALDKTEKEDEGVDDIMADLDFFLRNYGSTRAVRTELQNQKQQLVGLRRTVQWFLDRKKKVAKPCETGSSPSRTQSEKTVTFLEITEESGKQLKSQQANTAASEVSKAGEIVVVATAEHEDDNQNPQQRDVPDKSSHEEAATVPPTVVVASLEQTELFLTEKRDVCPPNSFARMPLVSNDFVNSGVVTAYMTALKNINEVCVQTSDTKSPENDKPQEITPEDSSMIIDQTEERSVRKPAASSISKNKSYTCSKPDCDKSAQVYGLCYRHGGYYTCKIEGCGRKAATRHLCRQHGGGTRCRFDSCEKFTVSGGKGYCTVHAVTQGIEIKRACKIEGCEQLQVKQGYCHRHRFEKKVGEDRVERILIQAVPSKADINQPSQYANQTKPEGRRPHHTTCKFPGCMKWVMREGDKNEYCPMHRDHYTSRVNSPRDSITETSTSFIHPHNEASSVQLSVVRLEYERRMRLQCKEPGCPLMGKNWGVKKGFCVRHGGGTTCTALAPAQQDETIADLTFFLDEFGSTRAVRVALDRQQSEITRLLRGERLQRDIPAVQQGQETNTDENAADTVDETMADLDFFLKTYGSTRAVREKLQLQAQKIASLTRVAQGDWDSLRGREGRNGGVDQDIRVGDVLQLHNSGAQVGNQSRDECNGEIPTAVAASHDECDYRVEPTENTTAGEKLGENCVVNVCDNERGSTREVLAGSSIARVSCLKADYDLHGLHNSPLATTKELAMTIGQKRPISGADANRRAENKEAKQCIVVYHGNETCSSSSNENHTDGVENMYGAEYRAKGAGGGELAVVSHSENIYETLRPQCRASAELARIEVPSLTASMVEKQVVHCLPVTAPSRAEESKSSTATHRPVLTFKTVEQGNEDFPCQLQ